MITRILFALWLSASLSSACTQVSLPTKDIKRGAQTVFVGTITALRDSSDGDRIATFRVSRIWKGHVSETFEMPMMEWSCTVHFAVSPYVKVGAELLVFAGTTTIHPQNGLIEFTEVASGDGRKRLNDLGSGRKPGRD